MPLITPLLKTIRAQPKTKQKEDTRVVGLTLSEIRRLATVEEFAEKAKAVKNRLRIDVED
ncbi:MAG: hypothetical protein D4Q77_01485 [Methanothrix sp.]|nr:MAG: hypothetical protein D4Q77_01485 [Methanothrix sp.]